jgi:hypothetical protein
MTATTRIQALTWTHKLAVLYFTLVLLLLRSDVPLAWVPLHYDAVLLPHVLSKKPPPIRCELTLLTLLVNARMRSHVAIRVRLQTYAAVLTWAHVDFLALVHVFMVDSIRHQIRDILTLFTLPEFPRVTRNMRT